jgi:AraC-like DNA-binding protein
MATRVHELRSPGPARGVLHAPVPDGRLEGRRVLPPESLAPFVHHFWSVRWALRTPFTAETLPHPSARLVLHEEGRAQRDAIAGVHTGRLSNRLAGEGHLFGIAFRPAMFQPLWRASMSSLTDRLVPLRPVLGSGAAAWARALHAEPELERQVAIAGELLEPRLRPLQPDVAHLRDLVERMAVDRTLLRVEQVSEAVDLDVRSLQRAFRRYVGVSPKWVLRRFRLQEAAEQLRGPHPPALAALAAALGYADQAHFARDFKLVVGQTPRAFARHLAPER